MVGIQGPPTDDGITIMHVMAHSPAEAAGLKMGDRICAVDGETIRAAWYGDPKHEWMAGPEGKTVVLGRCGGGTVRVTLRKFY
jgi:C-terminal processing protease CtpA/Prc